MNRERQKLEAHSFPFAFYKLCMDTKRVVSAKLYLFAFLLKVLCWKFSLLKEKADFEAQVRNISLEINHGPSKAMIF